MQSKREVINRVIAVLIFFASAASTLAADPLPLAKHADVEELLRARRAIAEVYWKHRTWPASNPQPKPTLTEVLSDAAILERWQDLEVKKRALAQHWGVRITGEMLQTEMRRIAKSSKDPVRLKELFTALGNDARKIAEYLVQPVLVERLLSNAYDRDASIHAPTRNAIDAAWKNANSLNELRSIAEPSDVVRFMRTGPEINPEIDEYNAVDRVLSDEEWEMMIDSLRRELGSSSLREGLVSPLLEDEGGFFRLAIDRFDEREITLIRKAWPKQSLEDWLDDFAAASVRASAPKLSSGFDKTGMLDASGAGGSERAGGASAEINPPAGGFETPDLTETLAANAGCTEDTWRGPLEQQPSGRIAHTAVWTGSEMIVWGGFHRGSFIYDTGGRYDPATDSWTPTTRVDAPAARGQHTAVWSGTEMLIWGGFGTEVGGRYDPVTDTWTPMSTTGAPFTRELHVAVWTGSEMIVWGGYDSGGGRYDPATDSWAPMSEIDSAPAEPYSTAVWTGSEMIVWGGGEDPYSPTSFGSRYDPVLDQWAILPTFPLDDRVFHSAVWTGTEMIIWGGWGIYFDPDTGEEFESAFADGAKYDPSTDSWTPIFGPNTRYSHTAVWTGTEMILYGGEEATSVAESYDPITDIFNDLPYSLIAGDRTDHTAVWTGYEMIVWGGYVKARPPTPEATGVIWTPSTSAWTETYVSPSASPRAEHSAIWTGSEMIIYGGISAFSLFERGSRYDPALDDWRRYSLIDAPVRRRIHRAVWTGSEMIVWGGFNTNAQRENTGGRYDPTTDTWAPTSTVGAPSARSGHAAAWTGSEMLVWGGSDGMVVGDGARYDPATDTWTPISAVNAPSPRNNTSFVWTGDKAFIWGGYSGSAYLGDGRFYDPATDTWSDLSTTGAPSPRAGHSSVWTDSEIIVWGGNDGTGGLDSGAHYDPASDIWQPTASLDAPERRTAHTAIWTGSEMVIWGGRLNQADYDSGARYDPLAMSWTPTNLAFSPSARYGHSAIWTGEEMLIWGGRTDNSTFNPDHGAYCLPSGCTATDWYRDDDGDGYGDSNDTISACEQPAGYADLPGDCNDADGTVYGRPGETRSTTLTHDGGTGVTTIEWLAPSDLGGTPESISYDLLRSSQAADFDAGATCLETMITATSSTDATAPTPSNAFFYLSRGRNACPAEGVGSLGNASSGTERSGRACP